MLNTVLYVVYDNGTYCHFAVRLLGGGVHVDCFFHPELI